MQGRVEYKLARSGAAALKEGHWLLSGLPDGVDCQFITPLKGFSRFPSAANSNVDYYN
jgi:hypothetical protein